MTEEHSMPRLDASKLTAGNMSATEIEAGNVTMSGAPADTSDWPTTNRPILPGPRRSRTRAPRKRTGSYRDPDLSDQWIREAEHRARHEFRGEAAKIILRLIGELRRINRETCR